MFYSTKINTFCFSSKKKKFSYSLVIIIKNYFTNNYLYYIKKKKPRNHMFIIISLWLVTAFLSSFIAKSKNRNPIAWFFIAFFLLGVFSLLLLMLLPARKPDTQKVPLSNSSEPINPTGDGFEEFAGQINQEKIFRISTSKTLQWYLIDSNGARQGPMAYHAFRLMIREQKKPQETYIWNTELEDWMQLKKFINTEILFDTDFD